MTRPQWSLPPVDNTVGNQWLPNSPEAVHRTASTSPPRTAHPWLPLTPESWLSNDPVKSGLLVEDYGSNAMLTSLVLLPGAPVSGHGHEAGRLLMAYGFGHLGLHRIWAGHRSDHHHMARIMHAAGLRPEAPLRQLFRTQGCWHDVTTYATVAPEWKRQATARELAILDGADSVSA